MNRQIAVPAVFFDDHSERGLKTPEVVRRAGRRIWISATDPNIPHLLSDAKFYADHPACMDTEYCSRSIIASARRTVFVLEGGSQRIPGKQT